MDIIPFIISYTLLGFLVLSILVLAFCWKDYYFIYNHRLLFVIGLVFSRSLTYYAVTKVIMWYLTDSEDGDFVRSVVLSNIQDSLSSLFVIFMANSADSFVGRFRTLVFSTTAYIGGLLILLIFNPYDVTWLIVVAIVLLALGKSGDTILDYVFTDLIDEIDSSTNRNKKRSLARGTIWWRISDASGALAAILWVAPSAFGGVHPTWKITFLICTISMTTALIIFCIGHNVYHQRELTKRPAEIFFRVFRAKLQQLFNSYKGNSSSYKDDVKVVRSLLRMFPMWGTLIVVSLISAAGSTFYIVQFSYLRGNDKIPAQMFDIIQEISGFVVLILYNRTCFRQKQKLKIGVGMFFSITSCVFAWTLEIYRLKQRRQRRDLGDGEITSISCLWLAPQFCVLGCMEGLTEDGSLNFFKSQIEEPIKSYREEYMEVVMCLGKLVNIVLISILGVWWFAYDARDSRLDRYYLLLVGLCSANFVIYCCIAKCFYKGTDHQLNPQSAQGNVELSENIHATTWDRAGAILNCFLVLLSRQASLMSK